MSRTTGVVDRVAEELLDGERLSGNGRLIEGADGGALELLRFALLVVVVVVGVVAALSGLLLCLLLLLDLLEAVEDFLVVLVLVVAEDLGVGGDGGAFLDDDLKGAASQRNASREKRRGR
jgi:hypothetical protein